MSFTLKTAPAAEPIDSDYVKLHTKIDSDAEDELLNVMIKAAREYAETFTRRPLVTQTWVYKADRFMREIELKPNLQTVTSVKYMAENGMQQTLNAARYTVDVDETFGTIYPAFNECWPQIRSYKNSVEVEFVCGYGTVEDVPSGIKQAMALLVDHWYRNRAAATEQGGMKNIPFGVDGLLWNYKLMILA